MVPGNKTEGEIRSRMTRSYNRTDDKVEYDVTALRITDLDLCR